ncbi:hypothetical protein AB0E96_07885 [Kitasatospora sp. NPDC036755]|uniref:hypothetical protein n=1 Tax=unclassified Kitasatospora TaxID=2633591 RepID=UPI0033DF7E50
MTTKQAGAGAAASPCEAAPAPLRPMVLRALVIESEIVIVDADGHEEPYDSAKH